jgi:serine/threonine-protein kinase HipA
MLAQSGLRRGDTLGFLARYGRDIAGALQIWDLDDPTEPRTPAVNALTDPQVRRLLEDPLGSPLGNDPLGGKSSLGGVQPKVVLAETADGWAQALGGFPTTHIVKPRLSGAMASVIFDEEYGARLSRKIGLARFDVRVHRFDGLDALVIERFDRHLGQRIHQEDFNQALGAAGNQKYQELGGVVSMGRIASTLRRHAAAGDLQQLARMLVFAVAIGNLDMHAKNLGLLHGADGSVKLAPAYDVVPQAHQANDGRMALACNKKYRHGELTRHDLLAELESWGLRRAEKLLTETMDEIADAIATETPLTGAAPNLQDQLAAFARNLQNGRPVGGEVSKGT